MRVQVRDRVGSPDKLVFEPLGKSGMHGLGILLIATTGAMGLAGCGGGGGEVYVLDYGVGTIHKVETAP